MSGDAYNRLTDAEQNFKRACEQIVQLNRRLDEMASRYEKANKENRRSFRYTLRLRMAITEGVRNMYYEFAARKADDITHLRNMLETSGVEEETETNSGVSDAESDMAADRDEGETDIVDSENSVNEYEDDEEENMSED